ncbi:uncharacterized protein BDW43DRAFT_314077 [Aspergillus alliaceus]|uniref:uncharacterized protein n=1 Tax=Petromyces alliaceus TaxID=209559 RepID=UPI0012A4091F|nr:uncharacterized protein BDW43DRAFT_314077 [Aspergillus alliaceus]KAB8230399.1 hypothetical protein BDW43DRAFT_314077 [Aspergillus alliaceus]
MVEGDDSDDLIPVPAATHWPPPETDELSGLVMNIVLPSAPGSRKFPIMVYIHGGSLPYGGANLPIFDSVNLVTQSIETGMPIVYVNFNYRIGFGGFLASAVIAEELQRDGHQGCGNFGFSSRSRPGEVNIPSPCSTKGLFIDRTFAGSERPTRSKYYRPSAKDPTSLGSGQREFRNGQPSSQ